MNTCFVIMGFGKKPDYPTGRTLDLDKTYEHLIRPAVEAAGLKCIRADEILHSEIIDGPMYELLQEADLVVADVSTANVNAFYELGVRHALRKFATVVIAEEKLRLPFDTARIRTIRYKHLESDIGASEVARFVPELQKLVETVMEAQRNDSPVYTFLPALEQPVVKAKAVDGGPPPSRDQSLAGLWEAAKFARERSDFDGARAVLQALQKRLPGDAAVAHQLAVATYKKHEPKDPDEPGSDAFVRDLEEARRILQPLEPHHANDPETLGLWGAIHKRLWNARRERSDLDEAIFAYEKGFYLTNDHYNGINHAYLLDVRAGQQADAEEAIADRVLARRERRRVLAIANEILDGKLANPWETMRTKEEANYWLAATIYEAYVGLGDDEKGKEWLERMGDLEASDWMRSSTERQVASLRALLA